jgi:hypothetical protein
MPNHYACMKAQQLKSVVCLQLPASVFDGLRERDTNQPGQPSAISPTSRRLGMTLSLEVNHGKGIRALQILKQEKIEQVSEEVSKEDSEQVEQAEQSEDRVRSVIP